MEKNFHINNQIDTNKNIVSQFFIQTYNLKNYDFVKNHFSQNYIDNSPANARGIEQCAKILKQVHNIFPDIKVECLNMIAENDNVVFYGKFKGTHKDIYNGIEASNKLIVWEAIEIFELKDNKITESWGSWPDYIMIKQMQATQEIE